MRTTYLFSHIFLALLFAAVGAGVNEVLFGAASATAGAALFLVTMIAGVAYIVWPHPVWGLNAIVYFWAGLYGSYAIGGITLQFFSGTKLATTALTIVTVMLVFYIAKSTKVRIRQD